MADTAAVVIKPHTSPDPGMPAAGSVPSSDSASQSPSKSLTYRRRHSYQEASQLFLVAKAPAKDRGQRRHRPIHQAARPGCTICSRKSRAVPRLRLPYLGREAPSPRGSRIADACSRPAPGASNLRIETSVTAGSHVS